MSLLHTIKVNLLIFLFHICLCTGPGEFGDAKERAKKRRQKWMDAERNAMTQSPMQEFQRHHRESDHVPKPIALFLNYLKHLQRFIRLFHNQTFDDNACWFLIYVCQKKNEMRKKNFSTSIPMNRLGIKSKTKS